MSTCTTPSGKIVIVHTWESAVAIEYCVVHAGREEKVEFVKRLSPADEDEWLVARLVAPSDTEPVAVPSGVLAVLLVMSSEENALEGAGAPSPDAM